MKSAVELPVITIAGEGLKQDVDMLAAEEPLEIRLAYGPALAKQERAIAVTMRTPGNDQELALGFLFTEGIIENRDAVTSIEHLHQPCTVNTENSILVSLQPQVLPRLAQQDRNFYTTSSCGVCGKASIEAIRTVKNTSAATWAGQQIAPALLTSLPLKLNGSQQLFAATGGLHAATLFNESGELLLLREDVGRHNAVDKLIGAALVDTQIDFSRSLLLLSGRASFELVQKAAMAGIAVVAAIGAPSSLAVSLAEEFGITLVGFLRNNRFNIYSAGHRIQLPVYENTH